MPYTSRRALLGGMLVVAALLPGCATIAPLPAPRPPYHVLRFSDRLMVANATYVRLDADSVRWIADERAGAAPMASLEHVRRCQGPPVERVRRAARTRAALGLVGVTAGMLYLLPTLRDGEEFPVPTWTDAAGSLAIGLLSMPIGYRAAVEQNSAETCEWLYPAAG